MKQCPNPNRVSNPVRVSSAVVHIGNTPLGGSYPIRIQSMANVSTMDTDAAVEQAIRMIEAGADYIRFAAQGEREAHNLCNIRQQLNDRGYFTPLIADIHFNPKAAEVAAAYVDKVRINPGNYTKQTACTDDDWETSIQQIRERFIPFLELCRSHRTAIRIGVNHGSLSERIMNRYGDTPEGMVESCMELLRICKETGFENVVVSIKSSNTGLMVRTVRLLVDTMQKEGMMYPLHLGVTEAGSDEDGRIKSAVGIGALLVDGIGDTIRVSLSEDPEAELAVARKLVEYITSPPSPLSEREGERVQGSRLVDFARAVRSVGRIGGANLPVVISDRRNGDLTVDPLNPPDYMYVGAETHHLNANISIPLWIDIDHWNNRPGTYPYFRASDWDKLKTNSADLKLLELTDTEPDDALLEILKNDPAVVVVLKFEPLYSIYMSRMFVRRLIDVGCDVPVILRCDYHEADAESLQIKASVDFGSLLIDGIGNGLFLCNDKPEPEMTDRTMFNILQATRLRISKTEYISCPGCGRTLFDLQTTVARIKTATSQLKGLKIGIMGCIVNGPGEMADADYGYVGAGHGRINLYKGKECVLKNIPEEDAVEELMRIIT